MSAELIQSCGGVCQCNTHFLSLVTRPVVFIQPALFLCECEPGQAATRGVKGWGWLAHLLALLQQGSECELCVASTRRLRMLTAQSADGPKPRLR